MPSFDDIFARALDRHGEAGLRARFPQVSTSETLRALPDDRCLAALTQRVFSAGFRWSVIEAKWPGFEAAFGGFAVDRVAGLDAAAVDALAQDARIVRNRPKILATVDNARFVARVAAQHGSFGAWLADWPWEDPVGLWSALKAGGSRLGGDSGPWALRLLGYDTFRFGPDVSHALVEAGVVDRPPTGLRAQQAAQAAIVAWSRESGLPLAHVSVVLACSTGALSPP